MIDCTTSVIRGCRSSTLSYRPRGSRWNPPPARTSSLPVTFAAGRSHGRRHCAPRSFAGLLALGNLAVSTAAPRAFFIFGDSLVDNGNNNYLATPPAPTRRPTASTPQLTPPLAASPMASTSPTSSKLGAEPTLPYLSPDLDGENLLVGANFASAGIGILNDTGIQFMNIIRITRQMEYFQQGTNGECDPELQRAAGLFNPQLVELIGELNKEIGSNVFIAANAFNMHMTFITEPEKYGFETSKEACCGQGPYNGIGLCTIASNLCPDRSVYVFWDAFHPTERANRIIVDQMLSGSLDHISPMNLSTALALDDARA
ncbi:unnamed protein product [Spirodela intermedia]|uniref:Uncharacterized protein n=1 Tax=Spirodela intermedia TaxID=51605 RepID=A0A7I8IZS2_SPIIN|nr:unnamed protein product [Spirodela intermedia]CAA6662550.1 unnamed protein product [Spirodela intermedia]